MIKIYKAKVENASEIKKLLRITWEHTYLSVYSIEQIDVITSEWHSLELLIKQIENPKVLFLIAKEDSQIVAMCNTDEIINQIVNIQRLHVLPTHQRKGVGSLLLEEVIKAHPKINKLELEVEKQNRNAIAFYENRGFKNVGEKIYKITSIEMPCFLMEKKL